MNDDRLDQLIRSSLEWQAEQNARHAPSLATSARRVAERLGPQPASLEPVVILRPGSGRSFQLLLAVILLALLAAVAVGSGLIRLPQPPPDLRPFGVGGTCSGTAPAHGVVFTVQTADVPTTLYEDGSLVTDRSSLGQSKLSAITGIEYAERRLSPVGIALVKDRIAAAGVVEGCRSIQTRESAGSIIVRTAEGSGELYWNPQLGQYLFARLASSEEETAARDLAEALEHPEAWLPDDAWIDVAGDRLAPAQWIVFITIRQVDYGPDEGIVLLPSGDTLRGSDPRYARVTLPDGQEPLTFGVQAPATVSGTQPRASFRCGMLSTEDAIRLAQSLDSMALGTYDEDDLYTTDLSHGVFMAIRPSIPAGYDCDSVVADLIRSGAWMVPSSPAPEPAPELDGVDPCALVPPSVDVHLGGVETRRPRPAELQTGLPGAACHLMVTRFMNYDLRRAGVRFYRGVVDHEVAAEIALSVLGDLAADESIRARPSWVNACLASSLPCAGAIVVWSNPYLVVIDFGRDETGRYPDVTLDTARAIAGEIVEELPE